VSARVRLAAKSTAKPPVDPAAMWKWIQIRRRDHHRAENMKILIQQDPSGDYWHNGGGWVGTQELATVYAGVVEALDGCILNRLANADIVSMFSTGHAKVRLSHKLNP
jgi:hypothetical protein